MTEPVHRDCGTPLESLYIINDLSKQDVKHVLYYCPACKVLFTSDNDMTLVNINEDVVHIDYRYTGYATDFYKRNTKTTEEKS
jgi:hypothetical protein